MFVLLLLVLAAGAAFLFFSKEIGINAPPPAVDSKVRTTPTQEKAATRDDWQKEAFQVLHGYLAATTVEKKLPFILNRESLAPRLEDFYNNNALIDQNTPADAFSVHPLTEKEYQRGIFLLALEKQEPKPMHVYAFFKRTPEGLKLDWETFVQTKYRTLQNFVEHPKPGNTGVFRVLMIEDAHGTNQSSSKTHTYLIADPANASDATKVDITADSEIGRTLSATSWREDKENRPTPRTATIELRWGGEPNAPKLEISRFICWEFFGLGGQESSPATQ